MPPSQPLTAPTPANYDPPRSRSTSPDDACGNNKKNILILSVIILFYWYWAGKPQFLLEIGAASADSKVAKERKRVKFFFPVINRMLSSGDQQQQGISPLP